MSAKVAVKVKFDTIKNIRRETVATGTPLDIQPANPKVFAAWAVIV